MQYLRAYAERAADNAGNPGDAIRFVASTENVARDGMVIPADAWQLDNFRKNPVALFCHDYFSRPPIGRVANIEVVDKQLIADVLFDQEDEFALMLERKVRSGVMSACSVGWDTLAFEPGNGPNVPPRVTKADLLDFSVVPVPSDPDGLKRSQKRSLEAIGREFLDLADVADSKPKDPITDPDPAQERATWHETAAQMVRLFRPFAQGPDAERESEYRRIAREYGRHGKTPPEFIPTSEVDALTVDNIRGLFLEGETELLAGTFAEMATRAGAVLSTRNQDDLRKAAELITGVLARAQKEADQSEEERAAESRLRELRSIFVGDQTK